VDGEIATKTLAELYLNQGNRRKALEIYQELLKREPTNTEIRVAIKTLEHMMGQPSRTPVIDRPQDLATAEKIKNLEQWQKSIRMIRKQRENRETH